MENKGSWVSGEGISSSIGITRSAVWKHVKGLREEGYVLESSPRKGYLLREMPDLLLPAEIRQGLRTRVLARGEIFHYKETESTNSTAKLLAATNAPEGTLVISEMQTGGRGRRGREWHSPSGQGLYLSIILRPEIPPAEAPKMNLLTAVSVAETIISLTGLDALIKWPNDILVHGKKIGGILTEVDAEMDAVLYMVVGVGINVNNRTFPPGLRRRATSLFLETGRPFSRLTLLKGFLTRFEKDYGDHRRQGFQPVIARWKGLTDVIGRSVRAGAPGHSLLGIVEDLDENGALVLRDRKGRIHRVFAGDITLRGGAYGGR